jgi:hypothetical protein
LGGARSCAKKLLDNRTRQVADTLQNIVARNRRDDILDEVAEIVALCREYVDGSTTTDDITDLEELVVVVAISRLARCQ